MAGRVTVSAGPAPVILAGMDATNATPAYLDEALTVQQVLPLTVAPGAAIILYVTDTASITPTVKDPSGKTLTAPATACRAGFPVKLGPFTYAATYTVS